MGLNNLDSEDFAELWNSHEMESRVDGLGQTETVRPESQTAMVRESNREVIDELPDIAGRASGEMVGIEVGESIGEGGMAHVAAAEQVPLGREVAVKRRRAEADTRGAELSLLQEAWVTGRLEHPNVVPVYRLGRDEEGEPAIVMKRIEGVAWSELLEDPARAPREIDDPLDWHLDILLDVCDAVEYAHSQRIIHRDLKPQNVMVGAFGEVYVVDWGLAVSLEADPDGRLPAASKVHVPAGTPAYIAPEMVTGIGALLCRQTDIYLLGGLLHRIITGEPPHAADRIREAFEQAYTSEANDYGDEVSDRLAEIARKAMARKPDDRYATVAAFRRAIEDFKRRRESYRLARSAERRLASLQRAVAEKTEASPEAIQEIFGECRFGFEKALEVSEDNQAAREGLQRAIEAMIEFELDRDGYEAASLLLADLPESNRELERRVEALGDRLESREQEFEELKTYRRETDVDLGRPARSLLALALGVLWAALGYGPVLTERWFDMAFGFGAYLAQGVIVAGFLGLAFYLGRRRLFQNVANKRILMALVVVFAAEWGVRYICNGAGVPLSLTIGIEMLMSAMGAGLLAATIDRRITWAAVPYLIGGLYALEHPGWVFEINGATNLVAMGLLAWAWWPSEV